jgi:hypothetical protein
MKIGDPVELRSRTIRYYIKNLGLLYIKPNTYEFEPKFLEEIGVLITAFLKKADSPKGKIVGYGARIDDTKDRYIVVTVKNKTGKIESLVLQERDVIKLKK